MSHASVVMVRCPTTGRELSTGVEMDTATFERLPDIHSRITGHSLANQMSALLCGSRLVNARSLARQSSSVCSNARLAVHQQSKCGERLGRLGGASLLPEESNVQDPKQTSGRYGCRGGATNGLVSTARLFFVRQLSSLSSAARL